MSSHVSQRMFGLKMDSLFTDFSQLINENNRNIAIIYFINIGLGCIIYIVFWRARFDLTLSFLEIEHIGVPVFFSRIRFLF